MFVPFEKYLPDYAPKVQGLVQAKNVRPVSKKLVPFRDAVAVSENSIAETPLLMFTIQAEDQTWHTYVLANSKAYWLDGTLTLVDATKVLSSYSATQWDYTVYGNDLVICNLNDAIQYLANFNASGNFADLTKCGGCTDNPPQAKCCEMFDDHLFTGFTKEGGTLYPRRLRRSAKGDLTDWDVDVSTGASFYDLPAWGEEIIALKTLGNFLIVYMTNSIWKVYPVGIPIWFGYDRIATGIKPLSLHSVVQLDEGTHLVLAENDIYIVTGNGIKPIADGIREVVIQQIHPSYRKRITNLVDYKDKVVQWSFVSTNSADNNPDKILTYNYAEDRFTLTELATHVIGSFRSPAYTIDGLDDFGDVINDITSPFIDAAFWKGGTEYSGVVATDLALSTFDGDPLDATIKTGEIDAQTIHRVYNVRPIIERPAGTVTCKTYSRMNDIDGYSSEESTMRSNGKIDVRKTGKYFEFEIGISGEHEGIIGINVDTIETGKR